MPKVSVIVPIYGVEKYIERCACSLFNQTMSDIEYIFVDDCTPDKSMEILNNVIEKNRHRFAAKKWSVRIARMPANSGQAAVRRHGMQLASGEYTIHCDSDDWVSPDIYKKMYEKAKTDDSDIVSCNYYVSDGKTSEVVNIDYHEGLLTGPLWNRLIRSSLYKNNDIIYPVANKAEDGALMVQMSFFAKKISFVDDPLYYYYQNPESICHVMTHEAILKRLNDEIKNTDLRVDFLKKHEADNIYKDDIIIWKYCTRQNVQPYIKDDQYYDIWKNTYPEINKDYFGCKYVGFKGKLKFLLLLLRIIK